MLGMRLVSGLGSLLMVGCAAGGDGRSTPVGAPPPGGSLGDRDATVSVPSPVGVADAGALAPAPSQPGEVPPGSEECNDVVDLVLAIDLSSSMGFVHSELRADIGEVVGAANALAPDAHFGLLGFVDNHAFDTSGDLEGGVVHTGAPTLQAGFDLFKRTYTDEDRNPGDGPGGLTAQNPICEENSLDALYAAATEFPWRDNATRVLIVATDDTFLEAPDNYGDRDADGRTDRTDFPREGDYPALRTVPETVQALQDAKIRVFSFTLPGSDGLLADLLCGCGTGCRFGNSRHLGDGWSVPYASHPPLPESTDGANFNLDEVRSGALGLADTIREVVVDSYCVPPII